jgi:hypothetical protein
MTDQIVLQRNTGSSKVWFLSFIIMIIPIFITCALKFDFTVGENLLFSYLFLIFIFIYWFLISTDCSQIIINKNEIKFLKLGLFNAKEYWAIYKRENVKAEYIQVPIPYIGGFFIITDSHNKSIKIRLTGRTSSREYLRYTIESSPENLKYEYIKNKYTKDNVFHEYKYLPCFN